MDNETDLTIVEMAGASNCPTWGIPLCQLVSASKHLNNSMFVVRTDISSLGDFRGRGCVTIILTGGMTKRIYHRKGDRLHPSSFLRNPTQLISLPAVIDGQPSGLRCDTAGWLCVGFYCRVPDHGMPNDWSSSQWLL